MIKVGDKVVCIYIDGIWFDVFGRIVDGPKYQDELIVDGFDGEGGLIFNEYCVNEGYSPKHFRKLHDETVENILKLMAERPVIIS